jgi:hypothetical protein
MELHKEREGRSPRGFKPLEVFQILPKCQLTVKIAFTVVRRRMVRMARSLRTHSFESRVQRKLRELEAFYKLIHSMCIHTLERKRDLLCNDCFWFCNGLMLVVW